MKKAKKHNFKYNDPDRTIEQEDQERKAKGSKSSLKSIAEKTVPDSIKKDLKKTFLTIVAFVVLLSILFVVLTKTDLLKPVLKLFSL